MISVSASQLFKNQSSKPATENLANAGPQSQFSAQLLKNYLD